MKRQPKETPMKSPRSGNPQDSLTPRQREILDFTRNSLEAGSARGILLVEQLGLPLIGSVAAGSPLLAVENQRGKIQISPDLFSPRADYLLQVRGNSMTGAGIFGGISWPSIAPRRPVAARSSSPAWRTK
jgi:hypothetical protein